MKRYTFLFTTKIKFSDSINNHYFMLRYIPGNYQFQRIYDEEIKILPETDISFGKDSFENQILSGTIKEKHDMFEYTVCGEALLSQYKSSEVLDRVYLYETKSTHMSKEMQDFADSIELSSYSSIHEKVFEISNAVHGKLQYSTNSTDVNTTAEEAFEQGKGVCQDYAQITIALLRNFGIPARYCAGLMLGEGKTHAWVEYYDGGIWYGIDPTNNKKIEYGYIKISSGRDCLDCGVDRGSFVSEEAVSQDIHILVKVGEIDD